MVRLRKLKSKTIDTENMEYVDNHVHKDVVEFHPHCVIPALAVAEAKQFDEIYALAHNPVRREEETDA